MPNATSASTTNALSRTLATITNVAVIHRGRRVGTLARSAKGGVSARTCRSIAAEVREVVAEHLA